MKSKITIQAKKNTMFFAEHIVTVFDPTGSHGAENALAAMKAHKKPIANAQEVLNSLEQLCEETKGQYEIMNHCILLSLEYSE